MTLPDDNHMPHHPHESATAHPHSPGCWLILQGLGTPFFRVLAEKIEAVGGKAIRVNFCGGDQVFGGAEAQVAYRGREDGLTAFYTHLFDTYTPRGILLFGDQRPVHRPAIALARKRGLAVLCIEEGYLRPGWLTLEHGGTNAASLLPRDAHTLQALAAQLNATSTATHDEHPPIATDFPARVRWDLWHKAANIALGWRYRGYRTHRPYPMRREAAGWLRRLARRGEMRRHTARVWQHYRDTRPKFFLLPLQLNSDTQMRIHADVGGVDGFLDTVLASFAAHAPADVRLLIKNHPLDNGVLDYRAQIDRRSVVLGIADRVDFIDGGDLEAMLDAAQGTVLVNSTVGLAALTRGVPVHASGKAIYRMPGITSDQPLDAFWSAPAAPDPAVVDALIAVLKGACMIPGDLFSKAGIATGTDRALDVIMGRIPRLTLGQDGQTEVGPCP